MGGGPSNNNNEKGNKEDHGHGGKHHERGYIQINDRIYSPHTTGCVTLVNGLGSTTFEILNESRKTIEVFQGVTCDNGAPLATVGPHSTGGVTPDRIHSLKVKHGVAGSFRIIDDHYRDDKGDY